MTDEDPIVRQWCETLAAGCERQAITRNEDPYLDRYFVAGWTPRMRGGGDVPAVFLHHFVNSDPGGEVHSHPWQWAASLILVGGYREYRCTPQGHEWREYHAGDVNILAPDDRHRIELLGADCWTLFLVGAYAHPWRFAPLC